MLNLYLHNDGAPFTSDPDEKLHLIGISLEEFGELKRLQFKPEILNFHDDCIWKSELVKILLKNTSARLDKLKQTPGFRSDCLERFEAALKTALRKGYGLLFLCD